MSNRIDRFFRSPVAEHVFCQEQSLGPDYLIVRLIKTACRQFALRLPLRTIDG